MENALEVEVHQDSKKDKGQFVSGTGKPHSGKGSRLLQHLNTRISVATEVILLLKRIVKNLRINKEMLFQFRMANMFM